MRKALLALLAVSIVASLAPAHAATVTYTYPLKTIVAPTHFGSNSGVMAAPTVSGNPTDPDKWEKMNVVFSRARCAYIKQQAGTLPAGSAQDTTTGKLGFVFALPTSGGDGGFNSGDKFTLTSDTSNPTTFDFDVAFYSTLGVCVPNEEVVVAEKYITTVPLEGDGPRPNPTDDPYIKNTFTTVFNDSGTVGTALYPFNANYAIVVMPAGANGKFKFSITY